MENARQQNDHLMIIETTVDDEIFMTNLETITDQKRLHSHNISPNDYMGVKFFRKSDKQIILNFSIFRCFKFNNDDAYKKHLFPTKNQSNEFYFSDIQKLKNQYPKIDFKENDFEKYIYSEAKCKEDNVEDFIRNNEEAFSFMTKIISPVILEDSDKKICLSLLHKCNCEDHFSLQIINFKFLCRKLSLDAEHYIVYKLTNKKIIESL